MAIEASEGLGTREWVPEKPLPDGQFDLITMGHVINELYQGDIGRRATLVEKVLEKVKR